MKDILSAKRYISLLSKKHRRQFYGLIICNLMLAVCDSGAIVSTTYKYNTSTESATSALLTLVLIMVFTTIIRFISYVSLSIHVKSVGERISKDIFAYIINYNYEQFILQDKEEIRNTISYRLNVIVHGVHTSIISLIVGATTLPCFVIALSFMFGMKILLVLIPAASLLIISYSQYKDYLTHSNKIADRSNGRILAIVENVLQDPRSLKIYSLEGIFLRDFEENNNRLKKTQATNILFSIFPRTFVEIGLYGTMSLLLLFGQNGASQNILSTTPILLIIIARVVPILTTINTNLIIFRTSHVAINTVVSYLGKIRNMPHGVEKKELSLKSFNRVIYNNIEYTYPNTSKQVLKISSIILKKNSPLIITGKSGSGKSTLLDIISGLLPSENIDVSVNGVNYSKKIPSTIIRNYSSYCGQTTFLIPGTLKSNLINKDSMAINDNEIYSLLEEINLSNINLDQIVNDGKDLVSGGQKQRINILRCLMELRPMLFMDEPTSSLDSVNTELIIKMVERMSFNRILTIISHEADIFSQIENSRLINLEKTNKILETSKKVIVKVP